MTQEEIEKSAREGSINHVNGYTFFVEKETNLCIRVSPEGKSEVMPQLIEEDNLQIPLGKYINAYFDPTTQRFYSNLPDEELTFKQ